MTPDEIAVQLLTLVVSVAPGYLAALTGHQTDAEALDHARARVGAIPLHPARDAIDDEIARAPTQPPGVTR